MGLGSQHMHCQQASWERLLAWVARVTSYPPYTRCYFFFSVLSSSSSVMTFTAALVTLNGTLATSMPASMALPTMKPRHPDKVVDIIASESIKISFFI